MRKKIFTLFILSFMAAGIFSSVNAQVVTSARIHHADTIGVRKLWPSATIDAIALYHDTVSVNANKVFSECAQTLEIKISPALTKDTSIYIVIEGPDFIDFPDSILIDKYHTIYRVPFTSKVRPAADNGSLDSIVTYIGNQTKVKVAKDFYNTPTCKVSYNKPTALSDGWLNLNIEGGSKELLRTIDNGLTWELASTPFSKKEVANLSDVIYLKEPNSCTLIDVLLDNGPTTPIIRRVIIASIDNAEIGNKNIGENFIASGSDFIFTLTPKAGNESKVPVVTTDRTDLPDSEGVIVTKNENGSFTVCIRQVRSAVNVGVTFVAGNENGLDNNSVWSNNGQLYISAINYGNAQIYSTAGALVKTITLSAGETNSTSLKSGFYVVVINGKAQKVIVK